MPQLTHVTPNLCWCVLFMNIQYCIYVQYSIVSAISLLNCLEWPKIPHSSGYLANYCQLFFRCYFCVHFIPPLIVTGFC